MVYQRTIERPSTAYKEQNRNKRLSKSSKDMMFPMMITIKTVVGIGKLIPVFLI